LNSDAFFTFKVHAVHLGTDAVLALWEEGREEGREGGRGGGGKGK